LTPKKFRFLKKITKKWEKILDNGVKWVKMGENGKKIIIMSSFITFNSYAGEYSKALDDKRRIVIPAKWRFEGDETETAYLALPNANGSITIFPPKVRENIIATVSGVKLSDSIKQKSKQKIFRKCEDLGCDKQGRISLSEKLIAHANIAKEAILVGSGDVFNIWNPEKLKEWDECDSELIPDKDLEILGL